MSVQVTIPTAQHRYFDEIKFNSYNVTQVTKLLRFSCTALDLGSPHYKMWDYTNKGLTNREKYLDWVARWKENYLKLSNIIRFRKQMRVKDFFWKYEEHVRKANSEATADMSLDRLYTWFNEQNVYDLAHLQKCAQHMLNGRFIAKLAGAEMRRREIADLDASFEVVHEFKNEDGSISLYSNGNVEIRAKSIELHPA